MTRQLSPIEPFERVQMDLTRWQNLNTLAGERQPIERVQISIRPRDFHQPVIDDPTQLRPDRD